MFDCILPAAFGQQGVCFTSHGRIELRRGIHRMSSRPLDENCSCPACTLYTRAYLHHLVKADEFYVRQILGLHNLTFYKKLMDEMRGHILAGDFASYYNTKREELIQVDLDNPIHRPHLKTKNMHLTLGNYEVVRQGGFSSIRQIGSGEIMHPVSDPLVEAKTLYVDQTDLGHELMQTDENPFVIWDVGLGAGTNAMAAIFAFEELLKTHTLSRKMKIVSFENDLDSLRLAVRNPSSFMHVRHAAPASILKKGSWTSPDGQCKWILLEGDFIKRLTEADKPSCIYYDPFSLHTDIHLWNRESFEKVFACCDKTKLFTYSAATKVRGALLSAGFFVGFGPSTGPKKDTTVAFSSKEAVTAKASLLDSEWLERWKRSESKYPKDSDGDENAVIEEKVLNHQQFSKVISNSSNQ
jgi:queuine tRNA-ribosyltransferase